MQRMAELLIQLTKRADGSAVLRGVRAAGSARAHRRRPGARPRGRARAVGALGRPRPGRDAAIVVRPPAGKPGCAMTWIRTIPLAQADEKLRRALEAQRALYPAEYATPVQPTADGTSGIVASHSLIPDALYHAFATFGVLMAPELPLQRRQHELITTMVSVANRCRY